MSLHHTDTNIEEKEQASNGAITMFRILRFFSKKYLFVIMLFLGFIYGGSTAVYFYLIGRIIADITAATISLEAINKLVVGLVLYFVYTVVTSLPENICMSIAKPIFANDLRKALFNKLINAKMTFCDQVQAGELLSKITTDCTLVSEIYFSKGTSASEAIGQVISTTILSFIVSWQITLACIGCYILTYLVYFVTSKFSNKYWPLYTKATTDANTKAEEIITSFKTVKAFNNELFELQKYRSSLDNTTSVFNSVGIVSSIKDGLVHLIMYLM